jgi:hypothetical protein
MILHWLYIFIYNVGKVLNLADVKPSKIIKNQKY